jgi:hypothetical protein
MQGSPVCRVPPNERGSRLRKDQFAGRVGQQMLALSEPLRGVVTGQRHGSAGQRHGSAGQISQ